jgi:glutathione synthase/RimK-type ligase-like ATP-grasp enzyme
MAVLIISSEQDEHALAVGSEIARLGARFEIVDAGAFPDRARLTLRYECCSGRRGFTWDDGRGPVDLAEFGAVWWRRPNHPCLSGSMARPSHRQFAANESQEALNGLWHSLDAEWINDPPRDSVAQRKAFQLAVAQDVGFTIPATLMTSDPFEARRFVDARGYRNVIYKSFSSTEDEWRETRLLKPEELELLGHVRHAPVIFQGYVEAVYDLRITIVGERIFAAAIHSQETDYTVDCRIDIGNARIEAVSLPAEVEARLLALMRRMGLVYGAVDMRLKPNGEYVFLEINPAGQFYYIEVATGLRMAEAMALALVERDRARAARPRAAPAGSAAGLICADEQPAEALPA